MKEVLNGKAHSDVLRAVRLCISPVTCGFLCTSCGAMQCWQLHRVQTFANGACSWQPARVHACVSVLHHVISVPTALLLTSNSCG